MTDSENNKLLVVGITWPPETFLANLLDGLAGSGFSITVACSSRPDKTWLSLRDHIWLYTPAWEGSIAKRTIRLCLMAIAALTRSPVGVQRLRGIIRSKHAADRQLKIWYRLLPFIGRHWDAIYFSWNSAAIEHLPLFELGIPVVVSCRGSQVNVAPHNPNRFSIQSGLEYTLAQASAVHCVSLAIQREAQNYGLEPEKSHIISPAVDSDFFYPLNSTGKTDTYNIITTGSLIWRKGYEYALMAIQILKQNNILVKFGIIGDGPELQRIQFTIQDLGLGQDVRLHGRLAPEGVRQQLHNADVFLLSSLSEGISNALLEAMACGLPVVTTECGGMPEAVEDGVEGFVTPVRDPHAMAEKLHLLYQDSALRSQMGAAGRERVLRDFRLDEQIPRFVNLFAQLKYPVDGIKN